MEIIDEDGWTVQDRYGLEQVTELSLDDTEYAFVIIGAFYDPVSGGYFVGTDSGCSCPIPWDVPLSRLEGPMSQSEAASQIKKARWIGSEGSKRVDFIEKQMRAVDLVRRHVA